MHWLCITFMQTNCYRSRRYVYYCNRLINKPSVISALIVLLYTYIWNISRTEAECIRCIKLAIEALIMQYMRDDLYIVQILVKLFLPWVYILYLNRHSFRFTVFVWFIVTSLLIILITHTYLMRLRGRNQSSFIWYISADRTRGFWLRLLWYLYSDQAVFARNISSCSATVCLHNINL